MLQIIRLRILYCIPLTRHVSYLVIPMEESHCNTQLNQKQNLTYSTLQICDHIPIPAGESFVDCGELKFMPDVAFSIGTKQFVLKPEQVLLLVPSYYLSYFMRVQIIYQF
jgi:hypothetical protein